MSRATDSYALRHTIRQAPCTMAGPDSDHACARGRASAPVWSQQAEPLVPAMGMVDGHGQARVAGRATIIQTYGATASPID